MSDAHAAGAARADRRSRLASALGPRAALLLASPPEQLRNGDVHYKFRQDSDILYLTGFEEPGTVVLLRPDHPKTPFVMFVRPRNPSEETWTGRRAGIEGAIDRHGADAAFPIAEQDTKQPEMHTSENEQHNTNGRDEDRDARMLRLVGKMRAAER